LAELIEARYAGFVNPAASACFHLEVAPVSRGTFRGDGDLLVWRESGRWCFERRDFRAQWDPASRQGWIQQLPNALATDSVLRVVHTLLLAAEGGFLVHSASALRNGRAFLFVGRSGAGKTTLSRLAPPDVTLLSDEISYVRHQEEGYYAFGTPFTGELARAGRNVAAPIAALYVLAHGTTNSIEPIGQAEAARTLLENILFFAQDAQLVNLVFDSACEFVRRLPAYQLTFTPEPGVWELIG
jgi:hypothetical protein